MFLFISGSPRRPNRTEVEKITQPKADKKCQITNCTVLIKIRWMDIYTLRWSTSQLRSLSISHPVQLISLSGDRRVLLCCRRSAGDHLIELEDQRGGNENLTDGWLLGTT